MARSENPRPITTIGTTPGFLDLGPIEPGQAIMATVEVVAMSSTGLARGWRMQRTFKRPLAGATALVGTQPAPPTESDAGTNWTATVVLGGTNGNVLRVQCTGAGTVRWNATATFTEVAQPT